MYDGLGGKIGENIKEGTIKLEKILSSLEE